MQVLYSDEKKRGEAKNSKILQDTGKYRESQRETAKRNELNDSKVNSQLHLTVSYVILHYFKVTCCILILLTL